MLDYNYIYRSFVSGDIHPLYAYMYLGLIRYATRLLGETLTFMAEDCVQDSILKTYLAREEIKNESQWRSWLFVTIRNRAVDMIRKAENNGIYIEKVKTDGEWSDDDVSLDIVEQETVDIIYTAVQSLPEIYRQIFELSFEQALRNSEVAEQLAIAEITVKKRKARLLELLRQRLGRSISEEYILMLLSMQLADSV